jgi:flavodoxin
MKTAILYYSTHHGNTRKLLDAIAAEHEVDLIDVTKAGDQDLSGYDRIGLASGIYYSNYAKPFMAYAERNLPEEKPVFFIYTHGAPKGDFLKGIREVTQKKNCPELGVYHCKGFDTFGPFKVVGGIAKGHPTQEELKAAADFYKKLPQNA